MEEIERLKQIILGNQEEIEELHKQIADLRNTLSSALNVIKENKEKWKYLEGRFIQVNECTEENKKKCLLYEDMRCDGTACKQFIDLVALLEKACESGEVK